MRAVLAIAATVWFFGASFGLLARSSGLGVVAPLVMSATTFAGSAQFAVVSILGTSGGAAAAIAAAVLLGAAIAFALTPFTPAGTPIVAASAACLLGLRRRRRVRRQRT